MFSHARLISGRFINVLAANKNPSKTRKDAAQEISNRQRRHKNVSLDGKKRREDDEATTQN